MIRGVQWRRWLAGVVRRPLVLVGLLLLIVGAPEVIIGHTKSQSYRLSLKTLPPRARSADPTQLYPERTAEDEERAVVEAKVGYYELLWSAGRVLVLLGFTSMLIGVLHEPRRFRKARSTPETAP
jgi:hypothetical protein